MNLNKINLIWIYDYTLIFLIANHFLALDIKKVTDHWLGECLYQYGYSMMANIKYVKLSEYIR